MNTTSISILKFLIFDDHETLIDLILTSVIHGCRVYHSIRTRIALSKKRTRIASTGLGLFICIHGLSPSTVGHTGEVLLPPVVGPGMSGPTQ
jgi:hypothetical protein